MTTIASLFESQAEATKALDALAAADIDDVDIRVIESEDEASQGPSSGTIPALNPAQGPVGAAAPAAGWQGLIMGSDLEEEEADFFIEGVRDGGVLVLVEDVDEEQEETVTQILRDNGGRTYEQA
jgi:hypothetical protein